MKAKLFCLMTTAVLAVAMCFVAYARSSAEGGATREFTRGEVIVEIQPGASIDAVNARFGTTTVKRLYGTNFYLLRTPNGKKEARWRKRLAKDTEVLSAALNPVIASPSVFGRSTASFPDGYATVGLTQAEFDAQGELFAMLKLDDVRLRSRGAGVTVAIIDTGVDRLHPMFAGRLWSDDRNSADIAGNGVDDDADGLTDDAQGWDFVDNDNDPAEVWGDPQRTVAGHGTFIAGLVAMLAPDCRILPVRAFAATGIADAFTVAAAIKYAADHGAQVINLSLGSSHASELLRDAIDDARARGVFVVAAVGNDDNEHTPQFPSNLSEVLAVAAIDFQSKKAKFSNFGDHVDLSAPGVKLISAFPGDGRAAYAEWSGTSFAAPLAAAEAALVLSYDPRHADVKGLLETSATPIDPQNPGFMGKLGKGRVDPLSALQALGTNVNTPPAADIYAETELAATDTLPGARGKAFIKVMGARQEFRVEAYHLSVRTSYQLYIDGSPVGAASVNTADSANLGSLRFFFSTDTLLPAAINPVTDIRHVEVRADRGQFVILQGNFKLDIAGARRFLEKEARLVPTTATARVGGTAKVKIIGDYQELKIEVEGLQSNAAYKLVVDDVTLGYKTVQSGFVRAFFSTLGAGEQALPQALRPVTLIRRVEVEDARGATVLRGEFITNGTPIAPR